MAQQRSRLGAVALNSPAVGGYIPAGQQGSDRVEVPTRSPRPSTRSYTQSLSRRDLQVLAFVGRFDQVTKHHIHTHVFKANKSETPCDRALARLVELRLLARIQMRGSRQYIYQVGVEGWRLAYPTNKPFKLATSPKFHTLDIASVFIDIDSNLDLRTYETEPDNHVTIAHMSIEPDLYVEVNLPDGRVRKARIEVDLGTERPRQIRDKLAKYHYGLEHASDKQRNGWPLVIWVVPDMKRRAELEGLIKLEPAESRGMYRVCLFEDVVQTLETQ